MYPGVHVDDGAQLRGVGLWLRWASTSFRNRLRAVRGAPRKALATDPAGTNTRGLTGRSSPTGTPLRVTVKVSPLSRALMMRPLSLRSSRWVILRLISQV